MKKLKEFFTSKLFKRFCWNTLAGALTVIATYVADLPLWYAPIIFAVINNLTKEINTYVSEEYNK